MFNSSLAACTFYPWILGVAIHMSLGIVDMYSFVRPPLGSHEDNNSMSNDWSRSTRVGTFSGIR